MPQHLAKTQREIFIIPDNDECGRVTASKLLATLRAAGIPARIADLGQVIGLDKGADLADLAAAGWKREDLLALVTRAARTVP